MATFRLFSMDSLTGALVDELRVVESFSCSWLANGAGSFSCKVPLGLYDLTIGERSVAVFRDQSHIWSGPVTLLDSDRLGDDGVTVGAREVSWIVLNKRTMDADVSFNDQPVDIAQQIATTQIAKTADVGGSPYGGPIPNFTASVVGAPAAAAKAWNYLGSNRLPAGQAIDDLAAMDPGGFLYRVAYSGTLFGTLTRVMQFGEGTSLFPSVPFTVVPEGLQSFRQTQDLERSVNRLHGLSTATPVVLQNDSSFTQGDVLLEGVFPLPQATPDVDVSDWLRQQRRMFAPPSNVVTYSFIPGTAMPFAGPVAGGTSQWHLYATGPGLQRVGPYDSRPIASKELVVSGGSELVRITHMEDV